jgi:hypothetical protein
MPKYKPTAVSDVDAAFGGQAMKILPKWKDIPSEFKSMGNQWSQWAARWFFKGLTHYPVPRDGIDLHAAMRNLATVQRSFEPKHEHKEAGVAYLASLWFTSPDGEPIEKRS